MFYFWHVDDLVQDMRAGIVTEYEKMRYFLGTALFHFFAIGSRNAYILTPEERFLLIFFFLLELFIIIWGIYHCYRMNRLFGDNKNFIERFVCLSFPLGVKIGLLSFLIFFVGAVFAAILLLMKSGFIPSKAQTMLNEKGLRLLISSMGYIYNAAIMIIFYHILGKKIVAVSK